LVAGEDEIEFKHFRLTGTRDYGLPPEKCVTVEPDGVSLTVDMAKSDLLLETELPRFAERADRPAADGRRHFRLTPASLAAGRESGLTLNTLESWFQQRAGEPLSPAARLLLTASQAAPVTFRQYLVLVLPSEELADGVEQWPETASLILERLGPTTLAVTEENAVVLRQKLLQLGWPTVDA
jgi:hypothetical protein